MKCITRSAGIVAFVCLSVVASVSAQRRELPQSLGRLSLVKTLEGKDAKASVDQLHQKAVAPKSSVTGEYEGGNRSATLYASLYYSQREAKAAGSRMMQLIGGGNRVFGHYSEQHHGRLLIGRCVGLGQIHYLFQQGERVFWLSVDPLLESEVLEGLLKFVLPANEQ